MARGPNTVLQHHFRKTDHGVQRKCATRHAAKQAQPRREEHEALDDEEVEQEQIVKQKRG